MIQLLLTITNRKSLPWGSDFFDFKNSSKKRQKRYNFVKFVKKRFTRGTSFVKMRVHKI